MKIIVPSEFRKHNVQRSTQCFDCDPMTVTPRRWALHMCGEIGEFINVEGKLASGRWRNKFSLKSEFDLKHELRAEASDVVTYLDLWLFRRGLAPIEEGDLGEVWRELELERTEEVGNHGSNGVSAAVLIRISSRLLMIHEDSFVAALDGCVRCAAGIHLLLREILGAYDAGSLDTAIAEKFWAISGRVGYTGDEGILKEKGT